MRSVGMGYGCYFVHSSLITNLRSLSCSLSFARSFDIIYFMKRTSNSLIKFISRRWCENWPMMNMGTHQTVTSQFESHRRFRSKNKQTRPYASTEPKFELWDLICGCVMCACHINLCVGLDWNCRKLLKQWMTKSRRTVWKRQCPDHWEISQHSKSRFNLLTIFSANGDPR